LARAVLFEKKIHQIAAQSVYLTFYGKSRANLENEMFTPFFGEFGDRGIFELGGLEL
jgi:hypothetical protein